MKKPDNITPAMIELVDQLIQGHAFKVAPSDNLKNNDEYNKDTPVAMVLMELYRCKIILRLVQNDKSGACMYYAPEASRPLIKELFKDA